MGEEQTRARFRRLRRRQEDGELTEAEDTELASLIKELEAAEAGSMTPAAERLRQERETLEAQNRALEALACRKETLVRRLRDFLAEARAERRAIDGELAAVLAESRGSDRDE